MASFRNLGWCLVVGVVALASRVQAQSCTPPATWRSPLVFFCPDTPALATQVDGNFGQIVSWLEAKVGQVGQPVTLPPNSVSQSNLVTNAVGPSQLAPNAVTTPAIADNAVTRGKLAGTVAVYSIESNCVQAGSLTLANTCTYASVQCGTCTIVPRFKDCGGGCPPCPGIAVPAICTANNALQGYLVAP